MLRLINKDSKKVFEFYVMDAHHHLGEDEDGMEVKPIGANSSYSFCKKLVNGDEDTLGIEDELKENPERYKWRPAEDDFIRPHPLVDRFDRDKIKRKDLKTFSIDQIVVFPMHDVFRDKGDITYQTSNNFIDKWVKITPHSRRLIGYGRIDPNEPLQDNLDEMKRIVNECNLRGLKLHPQSDEFDIGDEKVKKILKQATKLNIPVIFHTSYGSEVKILHDMCNEIISDFFEKGKEDYIRQLKVIIGHCTYRSSEVFTSLSHPSIYGEMSTLTKPKKYLETLSERVNPDTFIDKSLPEMKKIDKSFTEEKIKNIFGTRVTSFRWHNKVMIGSDNPYMPITKLIEMMKGLFSKEIDLTARPIQNILAANLLRLINPRLEISNRNQIKNDLRSLRRSNTKLLEINPFVEPPGVGGVNTGNNYIRIGNTESTMDLFYKRSEYRPLSGSKEKIEKERFYSIEEIKEKHPYLFESTNVREIPLNPERRRTFSSI